MKTLKQSIAILIFCFSIGAGNATAQTSTFTYQGKLTDTSAAANGQYDFTFRLFDAASDGTQIGTDVVLDNVQATNGIFTVSLDFGASAFDGAPRWIEISVRKAPAPSFTPLSPRQPLTSAPYAIKSLNAEEADSLSSSCVSCVDSNQILSLFGGKVTGTVQNAINANFATFANDSSALGGQPANFYPRLNNAVTQTFTGNNTFSGNVLYTGNVNFQTTLSTFGINADSALFIGQVQINSLGSAGSTYLCRNASNQISSCSPVYVDLSSNQSISGFKSFTTGIAGNGAGLTNLNGAAINPATNITANVITGSQIFANQNISANGGITAGNSRFTGTVTVDFLGSAGSTTLCHNSSNLISTCSSSLRYKTNFAPFGSGISLVKRLSPITFNWKQGGMNDFGLGAEDVEKVEPLLVTYNEKGEVEGVKYDRLGVVLINAVKEQQTQIEAQQKLIESQQQKIDALKLLVCESKPEAAVCREEQK